MTPILSIEQLNKCFVNNKSILFIKKYPEYELTKIGKISSIDEILKIVLIQTEEKLFYRLYFFDSHFFLVE